MKTTLVIGDSYSAAREGDTGLDHGWPELLGIPAEYRQGVSGSTAVQWAANQNGILDKARATPSDVLIVSLLGNDAFAIESQGFSNIPMTLTEAAQCVAAFKGVLAATKRTTTYVLLYPDPFNGTHLDFNMALPVLRGAIREAAADAVPDVRIIDLSSILTPSDFNGSDIHPTHSGHQKIADFFKTLL